MRRIALDSYDYFILVRAVAFAKLKAVRNISDVFGEELLLAAESDFIREPLKTTPDELAQVSEQVAGYFGLSAEKAAVLAELPSLGQWAGYLLEQVGPRPDRIAFSTSGSTGEPKTVVRDFFFLEQDAVHLADLFPGVNRFLALAPPHHIYGFIHAVLIPKLLNVPCEDRRFVNLSALINELRPGDAILGFPHVWRLCVETGELFPPGVLGVTSTGPCPPEIIRSLKSLGLETMLEIYGSSENGAIGYRTGLNDPLTLLPTWKRVGEDRLVRDLEQGGSSAPFLVQDMLDWVDHTHFFVKKRLDHAVQVAGINVYPARVRDALLTHEAVADCAVRLMRPEEGHRLKAFVVLQASREADPGIRDALRVHLARLLSHVEQPASIIFGPELPKNELGKAADWNIHPGPVPALEQATRR
ncbi:AMP-binding protein [Desulfonatronum sp. SC1]|uniref:AMP-binding enzyme n=1 Tax=Desulfonatronum sp. SC1 TaxID=2109626 RepID=UPI000D30D4D6|nr:AMP-binding protein [Desulfonatronum sp. SC1]PTN38109.1 4-coumarate--CoA ligase [Desulfonatronum sp. SC1]